MFAIVIAIFALWTTPIILPFKIFVVFLHEASHALATILTGGTVDSMTFSPNQGGAVLSRGGNFFIIASAGYLGSLGLGAALFLLALQTNADRVFVGLLGAFMVGLSALYIREPFPLGFALGGGLGLILIAKFIRRPINDLILRTVGLTSMIYVPYDIFSDTLARSHLDSDARILSENFGGPTLFWGGLWLVISIVFLVGIFRYSLKTPSNFKRGPRNTRP